MSLRREVPKIYFGTDIRLEGAIKLLRSVGMLLGPALFTEAFAYCINNSHTWKGQALRGFSLLPCSSDLRSYRGA